MTPEKGLKGSSGEIDEARVEIGIIIVNIMRVLRKADLALRLVSMVRYFVKSL
jgi:hypothetical protein